MQHKPHLNDPREKAALRFMGVPFDTTEVNPLTRSEVKGLATDDSDPKKPYTKVPLAMLPSGQVLKESKDIITSLAKELPDAALDGKSGINKAHFLSAPALEWHDWCDRKFAVCMYPNITRTMGECWQSLGYVHRDFPAPMAYAIRGLAEVSQICGLFLVHNLLGKDFPFSRFEA